MKIILYKERSPYITDSKFIYKTDDMLSSLLLSHLNEGQWFVLEYRLSDIKALAQAHGWQVEIVEL